MGGYLWPHVLSRSGWVILAPGPFWGGYVQGMSIFPRVWYVGGVGTPPPDMEPEGEGCVLTRLLPGMGPRIPRDTVCKPAIRILLECFLVTGFVGAR